MNRCKSFFTIPIALLGIVLSLCVFALPAYAATPVEDLFELDGNLIAEPATGDDWGEIDGSGSKGFVAGPSVNGEYPGGNAAISTFILDESGNAGVDNIFTGGGSKDDLPIEGWNWTLNSAPDKDDLLAVGAAAYYGAPDELLIYDFGSLYAANGTSSVGNWFFIKDIGPCDDGTFGVVDSSDEFRKCLDNQPASLHTKGDVLIISENTNGGTVTNISVYKWVAGDENMCAKGNFVAPKNNLCLVGKFADSTCGGLNADPFACGRMNQVSTESVDGYGYMSKFPPDDAAADPAGTNGISSDDHPAFTFFESGINISEFMPDAECFASFMKNTRTSARPRSQLKDFAGGAFELCGIEVAKVCPKNRETATGGYCEISHLGCDSALDCGVNESCVVKNPQFLFGDTVRTQFAVTISKKGPAALANVELNENLLDGCDVVAIDGSPVVPLALPFNAYTKVLDSLTDSSTLIIECDSGASAVTYNKVSVKATTVSGLGVVGPETATMNDATCAPAPKPGLNLTKSCDGNVKLTYDITNGLMFKVPVKITVSNTGDEDLSGIYVVDVRKDSTGADVTTIVDSALSLDYGSSAQVYNLNYLTNAPDSGAITDEWLGCEVMFSDTARITGARGTYSGILQQAQLPADAPATCVFCKDCSPQ